MFFLFILIFVLLVVIAIHTSKIGIEVQNLVIDTEKPKGERINKDSKIFLYLIIFGKLKLFKKDVRNTKRKDIKFLNKDLDIKLLKDKDIKLDYNEVFKSIDIKKIDLNIQIGTEDAALTAVLVGILSGILGVIIRKPKYQVVPIYVGKNLLKINLEGIITIDLMQYIYKLISNNINNIQKGNFQKRKAFLDKKVEV